MCRGGETLFSHMTWPSVDRGAWCTEPGQGDGDEPVYRYLGRETARGGEDPPRRDIGRRSFTPSS
jgi:hypothetical protein